MDHFGNAADAWQGSSDELRAAGLGAKVIERLLEARKTIDLDQLWDKIIAQGIQILTWEDELYPPRLKEIQQPPPVLYVRGEVLPEDHFAGFDCGHTAGHTVWPSGGRGIVCVLAANGVTVVSGLARGVDAVAHSAALKAEVEQ